MRTRTPIAVLAALALAGGCVTEKRSSAPRGVPVRAPGADVELPAGPIASPVTGSTSVSRIQVQVVGLGSVPYDGQVLPLLSPDARLLAVQEGEPPTWPTLLATSGAEPPSGTRLAVYDISRSPIARVEFAAPLPAGLMLGRACDNRGFLVEAPQPDGSRWIGRVSWVAGHVEWLVRDGRVNAHAVLTPAGLLAYTRRAVADERSELVLRTEGGAESVRTSAAASYVLPMATAERDVIHALVFEGSTLLVEAVRIIEDPPGSRKFRLGSTLAVSSIATSTDPALAYQIAAPLQGAVVTGRPHEAQSPPDPLVLYHPRLSRMAVFDPRSSSFLPLAPRSVAAAHWPQAARDGYLCAVPEGLVFTPTPDTDPAARRPPDARVLGTPYVPRLSDDPERPVVLFGPGDQNQQRRLSLFVLRVPDAAPSDRPGAD